VTRLLFALCAQDLNMTNNDILRRLRYTFDLDD